MIYVLHGLHKEYDIVQSHILAAPGIPSTENLISRFIHLPSPRESGFQAGQESFALVSSFADRGGGGRGHGYGGGRGGCNGGRPQCTYCKHFGHTQESATH